MIAYLDSCVILRIVLDESNSLRDWTRIEVGVTSTLTRVETARVLDRLRLNGRDDEHSIDAKRRALNDILARLDFVQIDGRILEMAAAPLESVLGTLDAIHLATAAAYRATQPADEPPIVFTTHDRALANAAAIAGFRVIGAMDSGSSGGFQG